MQRIQAHPGSLALRHPAANAVVIDRLRARGAEARLLSVGCSWGGELADLALGLPEARLVAAEIEDRALRDCAEIYAPFPHVEVLRSDWDDLAARGPYDAILCNSVLCRYPEAARVEDLAPLFPFAAFEDFLGRLDAMLRPGGALMIYNANYALADTGFAADYTALPRPHASYAAFDNFVCSFARDGRKLVHTELSGPAFFIDMPEDRAGEIDLLVERLNQGLFIKGAGPEDRAFAAALRARLGAPRPGPGEGVAVSLTQVYRRKGPHAPGHVTLPLEMIVSRAEAAPGRPAGGAQGSGAQGSGAPDAGAQGAWAPSAWAPSAWAPSAWAPSAWAQSFWIGPRLIALPKITAPHD